MSQFSVFQVQTLAMVDFKYKSWLTFYKSGSFLADGNLDMSETMTRNETPEFLESLQGKTANVMAYSEMVLFQQPVSQATEIWHCTKRSSSNQGFSLMKFMPKFTRITNY